MKRAIFDEQHDLFRESFVKFVRNEVVPHHGQWEEEGIVPRELWHRAGELGFLAHAVPERFGGAGIDDFRFSTIVTEELQRAGATGVGFALHNDVVLPYLLTYATEQQQARWLPGTVTGETILAIAMTEPGTGSDLASVATTAVSRGRDLVLNGQKTFITNGIASDLVVVVARTGPASGARGLTLLVVERGMPGFERGRKLDKVGMAAQDTAELFFNDVPVPPENVLGEPGAAFGYLMHNLAQERLVIAVMAVAGAEGAFAATLEHTTQRRAFGQAVADFQNTRFVLAELATELQIARVFVDRCIEEHMAGRLSAEDAAMAKWWTTELQQRVMDRGVQLHGGYGYMREYPIARGWLDARAQTIYGGTTEIMKEIIGRSLTARS